MNSTTAGRRLSHNRLAAAGAAVAVAAGITAAAAVGAGAAHAGTMPITHPGEPTVAMTITNNTDQNEYFAGATAGSGQWITAPRIVLAPHTSETVVSTAPTSRSETDFVDYRLGLTGPTATYEVQDTAGDVNTAMSGINGAGYAHHFIDAHIATGYPSVNAHFTQW
ncbi:hypothetical protein nbrc107696_04920 [Gordonia spumicola]|uniref:Uncharacterized protein n=1 Tax=Gordonia spumicola TaxID=589161 RepID=A0A7I9V3Q5_9ACTN|nr:hypothetical protein [Gordonia spumicola]GEE00046.1 hypothetical protein nbrc107696_04920 [Gordonia spumicola]